MGVSRQSSNDAVELTLDPEDWDALRDLGHRIVDDALEYMKTVRERPAWKRVPDDVRRRLEAPVPRHGAGAEAAYAEFVRDVLPYPAGNIHPRFWGWVKGTGTPFAVFADLLAATMNANVSVCDDGPSLVEEQVLEWLRELMGFPAGSSGLLVSGASMANLVGLTAARQARAGFDVRRQGLGAAPEPLTLYASSEVHACVPKAVELLGLGREALRLVPVDGEYRIDLAALRAAVAADRRAGRRPVAVVGSAGTVNTGATDDLEALADFCAREGLWLHVDGAFGALARLSRATAPIVAGIERADSLAFDLHKWGYLPYEVACVLVRDRAQHRAAFAADGRYLAPLSGGTSARPERFADYGVQLSRGFRALKVWMSFKEYGVERIGRLIEQNVEQARYLADLVDATPELERLAPVPLNVVCFRYRGAGRARDLDTLNRTLLVRLQEEGTAVPSSSELGGRFALRAAITNHRSRREDFDALVSAVVRLGRSLESGA